MVMKDLALFIPLKGYGSLGQLASDWWREGFGLFVPMAYGMIGPTLKCCWRGAIVFLFGWDVDVVCQRMMILRALVPSICSM